MVDESVTEIDLNDNGNDAFYNGSKKVGLKPYFTKDREPCYTRFEPVVSRSFTVSVDIPQKGDTDYVVYHVQFEGLAPPFLGVKSSVFRRFSDFIRMHEKLVEKHLPNGIIIPPAPGKEVLDTARLKLQKSLPLENQFLQKRRLALERLFKHPVISADKDLLDFIQNTNLPQNPSATLSVGAKLLAKTLGNKFVNATSRSDESDHYFLEKAEQLAFWERKFKYIRAALTASSNAERELSSAKLAESQALSSLAGLEDHTGLSRALLLLSETQEKVGEVQATLANSQLVNLVECVADTIDMIRACKDTLRERVRTYRSYQEAVNQLQSKRDQKVKLETDGGDRKKLQQLNFEFESLTKQVDEGRAHSDEMSKTIKLELERFDVNRFIEIKKAATEHLKVTLHAQTKMLTFWEAYLKHAKSIA